MHLHLPAPGRRAALLLCTLISSCSRSAPPPPAASPQARVPPPRPAPRRSPLPQEELGTTSGSIAVGNLQAAIAGHESALRERPGDAGLRRALADLFATRGQYLGRLED